MQKVHHQKIAGKTYQEIWDYQHMLHKSLIDKKLEAKLTADVLYEQRHALLLCEHGHVYTLGRSGDAANLLLTDVQLQAHGIEYFPINRGGDITYHGPGQITGYPILDLDCFFTDVHQYVRLLEEVVIKVLASYGLVGDRIAGYTGVWISDERGQRKICAIGVHLSRWVTLHGFALNVNTDLTYFDYIVPCGIVDPNKSVTSMAAELGDHVPLHDVENRYLQHFADLFGCTVTSEEQEFK
jgi:lipoyl(octanoyl) transferase